MKAEVREISIKQLAMAAGLQPREDTNQDVVKEYKELMLAGAKFPPVDVVYDGVTYFLCDGYHRCQAASNAGIKTVIANIYRGSRDDAIKRAVGANQTHGLRRTNADKRRCIQVALKAFPEYCDEMIAKMVGVTKTTVRENRPKDHTEKFPVRIGSNGRVYKAERPATKATMAFKRVNRIVSPSAAVEAHGEVASKTTISHQIPSQKIEGAVREFSTATLAVGFLRYNAICLMSKTELLSFASRAFNGKLSIPVILDEIISRS